jgi:hypothetical protein
MEKPLTIKWISRLLLFRLFIIIVIISITTTVVLLKPEIGFFTGFANKILHNIGAPNMLDKPYMTLGYVIGYYIMPFVLIIVEYISISNKKRIGFLIAYIFDLVTVLTYHNLPLIPIIVLILYFRNSTLTYLKSE